MLPVRCVLPHNLVGDQQCFDNVEMLVINDGCESIKIFIGVLPDSAKLARIICGRNAPTFDLYAQTIRRFSR